MFLIKCFELEYLVIELTFQPLNIDFSFSYIYRFY